MLKHFKINILLASGEEIIFDETENMDFSHYYKTGLNAQPIDGLRGFNDFKELILISSSHQSEDFYNSYKNLQNYFEQIKNLQRKDIINITIQGLNENEIYYTCNIDNIIGIEMEGSTVGLGGYDLPIFFIYIYLKGE